MTNGFDRRQVLAGAAAAGAAAALPWPVIAQTGSTVAVRLDRDIQGLLAPPYRLSFQENNILRSVCEGLIAFKPGTYEWELAAASKIEQVSETEIAFELKPGRMFHGGFGEMTAEDVKWSFEQYAVPGPDGKASSYAADWAALDRVEVTGKYTGRILLKNPAPQLWLVVLPEGSGLIYSRRAWEAGHYRTDRQPVVVPGTGAYVFHEWVPNQRVVLRANPDYQGAKPDFQEIVIRPIREVRTAELALRSDEIQFTRVEPASAADMRRAANTTVVSLDSINAIWIGMNVEQGPLADIRVRKAIRAALDVDEIVQGAYDGAVGRAYGIVAPGLVGHWAEAPKPRRDVAAARRLLQEAGLGSGFQTKLTLLNRPAFVSIGEIAQAMLGEVGVRLELEVMDGGAFWAQNTEEGTKKLHLSLQRFSGKADPAFIMQWFLPQQINNWNWQRWNSPEYEAAYRRGGSVSDPAARAAAYIEAQRIMEASEAHIWLTHETNVFGYRSWLKPGILPNGDDMMLNRFARA